MILYTSVDSVVQLAAHVDVLDEPALHDACARARAALEGPFAVGRVIARPFDGREGSFARTAGRRDFSLLPPSRSHLELAQDAGVTVHSVGKVADLFAGRGFDVKHPGRRTRRRSTSIGRLIDEFDSGLVVANLVETDQVYGHRKDVEGFHLALREIDSAVAGWLERLGDGDLLILTADHGVDVAMGHSDHTREQVPLLAWRANRPAHPAAATTGRWPTSARARCVVRGRGRRRAAGPQLRLRRLSGPWTPILGCGA